jgi:hypothetical protein
MLTFRSPAPPFPVLAWLTGDSLIPQETAAIAALCAADSSRSVGLRSLPVMADETMRDAAPDSAPLTKALRNAAASIPN